jgi:hypothetical protein
MQKNIGSAQGTERGCGEAQPQLGHISIVSGATAVQSLVHPLRLRFLRTTLRHERPVQLPATSGSIPARTTGSNALTLTAARAAVLHAESRETGIWITLAFASLVALALSLWLW